MNTKRSCRLVFKKKFQMQLDALTRYLADYSPRAARNMNKTVFSNVKLLQEFPQLGKKLDDDGRKERRILIVEKYLILYTYVDGEIHLEMILEERQDDHNYI